MGRSRPDLWSMCALLRESTGNVFVAHSRLLILVVVAIVAGVGSSLFIAYEANALRIQLAALDTNGRNVVIFATASSASGESQIDRHSCERLANSAGVTRSGLLTRGPRTTVLQLGKDMSIAQASTNLFPQLREHQALIGSALTDLPFHGLISTDLGTFEAAVGSEQPVGIDTNSSLVLPLAPSTQSGTECLVVLDPFASADEQIPVLAAELDVSGQPIAGRQVTPQSIDPIYQFLSRVSQYLPLLIGVAGALVAALRNHLRAGEFAAYRLSGTSARSLAVIIFFEQAIVAGFGVLAATATLVLVHSYLLSFVGSFTWMFSAFAFWVAGSCIASLPVIMRGTMAMSKDR